MARSDSVAVLQQAFPLIQEDVFKLIDQLERRVYAQIDAGDLNPTLAMAAWMEKKAYHGLLTRLERQIRIATAERTQQLAPMALDLG